MDTSKENAIVIHPVSRTEARCFYLQKKIELLLESNIQPFVFEEIVLKLKFQLVPLFMRQPSFASTCLEKEENWLIVIARGSAMVQVRKSC